MMPTIVERIAAPFYFRSLEYGRHRMELEKSQWLGSEQLQRIQARKLRSIVNHAYRTVPFYHKKLQSFRVTPDQIRTLDDLRRLPLVTKDDIKNAFPDDILPRNTDAAKFRLDATSGSTGRPMQFFFDRRCSHLRSAAYQRFASWYRLNWGTKYALLWGSLIDVPLIQSIGSEIKNVLQRRLLLSAYGMSTKTMLNHVRRIEHLKPRILKGYTSALYVFAKFLIDEGIHDLGIEAVVSEAETLHAFQRQQVESALDCPVFNHYGSREIPSIAQECEEHRGLHVNAEDRIVEVLSHGEPVAPGETGELVVTDLQNYATPFIRYEIEDAGVPTDEPCACRRGLQLIKEIKGRTSDLIATSKGFVPGEFFVLLMKNEGWVRRFQVMQRTLDQLLIRVVAVYSPKPQDLARIESTVHRVAGADMRVDFEVVDTIPVPSSGKHRFIISEISQRLISSPTEAP